MRVFVRPMPHLTIDKTILSAASIGDDDVVHVVEHVWVLSGGRGISLSAALYRCSTNIIQNNAIGLAGLRRKSG